MARAAKAAQTRRTGREAAPSRPFAKRAFSVWHREQMVAVPAGPVLDAALAQTLRGIHDDSLVEWRS